jgi:hypothetical protein
MASERSPDEWDKWAIYVLQELERNREEHKETVVSLRRLENEITALRVRAGVFGLAAGTLPALAVLIWQLLQ